MGVVSDDLGAQAVKNPRDLRGVETVGDYRIAAPSAVWVGVDQLIAVGGQPGRGGANQRHAMPTSGQPLGEPAEVEQPAGCGRVETGGGRCQEPNAHGLWRCYLFAGAGPLVGKRAEVNAGYHA